MDNTDEASLLDRIPHATMSCAEDCIPGHRNESDGRIRRRRKDRLGEETTDSVGTAACTEGTESVANEADGVPRQEGYDRGEEGLNCGR